MFIQLRTYSFTSKSKSQQERNVVTCEYVCEEMILGLCDCSSFKGTKDTYRSTSDGHETDGQTVVLSAFLFPPSRSLRTVNPVNER